MAEPLFYSDQLADPGATLSLGGEEARHAAASRRLQPGDSLRLFNGRGDVARATLLRVMERGRRLELRIEERRAEPPPRHSIHLACALPKGERQNVLLDMATQLGMTRFTPLDCARSIVKPGTNSAGRWQKICLEACKQSGRLHLPAIEAPATPEELAGRHAKGALWIAHPSAPSPAPAYSPTGDVTILVGPEGGFTEAEVALVLARGGGTASLGTGILRIETAAVALLAALAWSRAGAA